MVNTLLGIKKGMTSSYDSRGRRVGATIIEVLPNIVTQVKTTESKDGYNALQLGIGSKKSLRKPQLGHVKKAGLTTVKYLKETRTKDASDLVIGSEIKVGEVFKVGDIVKATGVSKGKGFAGGVKRFGFAGGPKTHGQSDRHRAPGSSGSGTTPGRVYKGKRRPGHMGVDTVSYKNLEVVSLDKTANLITIKGGIPGATGGLVVLENIGKVKGYTAPPEPVEEEEEVADQIESEKSEVSEETEVSENKEVVETKEGEENAS